MAQFAYSLIFICGCFQSFVQLYTFNSNDVQVDPINCKLTGFEADHIHLELTPCKYDSNNQPITPTPNIGQSVEEKKDFRFPHGLSNGRDNLVVKHTLRKNLKLGKRIRQKEKPLRKKSSFFYDEKEKVDSMVGGVSGDVLEKESRDELILDVLNIPVEVEESMSESDGNVTRETNPDVMGIGGYVMTTSSVHDTCEVVIKDDI